MIMTCHVFTRFYTYDPDTADWQLLPAEHRDLAIGGLAWSPANQSLYSVSREAHSHAIETVHRFNLQGALTGSVALKPPLPVPDAHRAKPQLHAAGDRLILILEAEARRDGQGLAGIYAIDPESGVVSRAQLPAEVEVQ